jgi:hypothetical protein
MLRKVVIYTKKNLRIDTPTHPFSGQVTQRKLG